ncbi:MAG: hypothetical protein KAS17_07850 [Victivallaceae bacterium]|nr:hypothetical protein [Victivallaceae bacterium]
MAKAKYEDYFEIIMDLYCQGKKSTEIARILNADIDLDITNADESGIRAFIKRSLAENEQEEEIEEIDDEEDEDDDPSQEKIIYLSKLLEEVEKKNSLLQKEAVAQGKLLNNLENVKDEYEEIIKRYSILNDTMQETIIITKENVSRRKMYYMIAAGWIITIFLALFAGNYIGRCYARTAFHYLLTLTALPAGIFIGLAINYGKKIINAENASAQGRT